MSTKIGPFKRLRPIKVDRSYIENYHNPGTYWIKRVKYIWKDSTETQIITEMEYLLKQRSIWIIEEWDPPLNRYMNVIRYGKDCRPYINFLYKDRLAELRAMLYLHKT